MESDARFGDSKPPAGRPSPDVVEVAVTLPVFTPFTYRVPKRFLPVIVPGIRVLVPFGRRRVTAYVLGRTEQLPDVPLKEIADVLDDVPLFPERMLTFFKWAADYYIHPLGEVIQSALPAGLNVAEKLACRLTAVGQKALGAADLPSDQRGVVDRLLKGPCQRCALPVAGTALARALREWERQGWIVWDHLLSSARTRAKTALFVFPPDVLPDANGISLARKKLLALLNAEGPLSLADLRRRLPSAAALARAMAHEGQLELRSQAVWRDPFGEPIISDKPPVLTDEQQRAVAVLGAALQKGFTVFLLAGVTGSGKTEIYLHLARSVLEQGRQVLVLVPEIALISQTGRAFRARFGDCVAVLHSGLSNGERYDQWRHLACGQARIAVGARSAIFAPLSDIGLIIVDEEHDDSYKQEGALRYNARDLAVVRAMQEKALVVLGSATPSMQSAYNARIGKFSQVTLGERVDNRRLPQVIIEDLTVTREERGARRFLTPALIEAIDTTLQRREQVLLFLNRRGFAGTLVCADCGAPLRCDSCDISLTYHKALNAYQCHYCGHTRAAVTRCGRCGSAHIKRLGFGTEKVEESVKGLFPSARVVRMDRDTTSRKGALLSILKALRDRRIDILVGTQMVAKGHDFPHVTLVGIVCADLSLSMPDFRAGERTFQLLAQVAGRAGRGESPGRVILQTFNPEHFSITAARQHDFEAFYRQEIEFRKMLRYPPFTRMVQIRIRGKHLQNTADQAKALGERCVELMQALPGDSGIEMLGPIEAPLRRVADQFRWQILLKGPHTGQLHSLVRSLLFGRGAKHGAGKTTIEVDVDPVFLM